jgi:hypothetical protein
VFVDNFSGLSYVHSQMSTDAAATIEAKKSFEPYAKAHGVTIGHYHADNGIFASKEFMDEVSRSGQTITFCAVNAHHQNGKMFMEIPQGFNFKGNKKDYCLELTKNLYGQKQAGRVWNEYLHEGLIARGFVQSQVDMCVYYRGSVVLLLYVDDGCIVAPKQSDIDEVYQLMSRPYVKEAGKEEVTHRAFNMTDKEICRTS